MPLTLSGVSGILPFSRRASMSSRMLWLLGVSLEASMTLVGVGCWVGVVNMLF